MHRIKIRRNKGKQHVIGIIILILFAGIAAGIVSHNWYQFMLVQGQSMEPELRNFQLVFLDKYSDSYENGDIIAFFCENLDCVLVKRIVASGGDSIVILNRTLYVNGRISMDVPDNGQILYGGLAETALTVPEGAYFVLGDNHDASKDSRYTEVGLVHEEDIMGKVIR